MNIMTPYTGSTPNNEYVFEEKVKYLLRTKNIGIFSGDQLVNLLSDIDINIEEKHQIILDTIQSLPKNQNHNLSILKNIMTMDGRVLAHFDKTSSFNDRVVPSVNLSEVLTDPTKNTITMSKLIKSNNTLLTPLFSIATDTINRKYATVAYGKLLLEIRISTPLGNFKGFITSGMLNEGKCGIGFFAEYNKSVDDHKMFIIAHRLLYTPSNIVVISMLRLDYTSGSISVYDQYLPTTIQITPLVHGPTSAIDIRYPNDLNSIKIDQSLTTQIQFPSDYSWIYGIGNLNTNGHGPIDCSIPFYVGNPNFSNLTSIIPEYYPGNRGKNTCKTNIPIKSKTKSKLFNLKIQPTNYSTKSEIPGSHVLRSNFGSSNFDMFNLLMNVYQFVDLKPYRCFGNIIMNGIIIPVIGFVLDSNLGRVTFTISPYFTIPSALKNVEGIDSEYRGLRIPLIVFNTNINTAHSYKNNGFIGDVNGESGKFMMGFDTSHKAYTGKNATYELSLVDITIELKDCTGLIGKLKWGAAFRYSGDFNRYNYDFTKHDYDTYPFPGENRDISDKIGNLSEIPSLNPEALVLATSDNKYVFVWVDNLNEYISYSSNNL